MVYFYTAQGHIRHRIAMVESVDADGHGMNQNRDDPFYFSLTFFEMNEINLIMIKNTPKLMANTDIFVWRALRKHSQIKLVLKTIPFSIQ